MTKGSVKWLYDLGSKEVKIRNEYSLDDGYELGLIHSSSGSPFGFDLQKGVFKLQHDAKKKWWAVQYSESLKPGTFRIRQEIPDSKWETAPSPFFELTTNTFKRRGVKDKLRIAHDFSNRTSYFEELVTIDGRHDFRIFGDSSKPKDSVFTLSTASGNKYVSSLGLRYSRPKGPAIVWESKPTKGLKVKLDTKLQNRVLTASVLYKPKSSDGLEFYLDYEAPLNDNFRRSPKVGLMTTFGI